MPGIRRRTNLGKKSGGPPTPRRPAFAFLFTPKLPLGGRSGKIYCPIRNRIAVIVKKWQHKIPRLLAKRFMVNLLYLMIISGSTTVFRYRPPCLLRATETDAASFLQGQFTKDLSHV